MSSPILDIGSRRELFVDHYLIERMENTCLKLHPPHPAEVVLKADLPWEGIFNFGMNVIYDPRHYIYRMYYRGMDHHGSFLCYAESCDGVNWTKPNLGVVEVAGTRQNNVLSDFVQLFLDTKPGTPAAERFKAVTAKTRLREDWKNEHALDGRNYVDMFVWSSADSFRWKKMRDEPVFTTNLPNAFDSIACTFWSESEGCYVCYIRYATSNDWKVGKRSIFRITSKDFLNWSDPVLMNFGNVPRDHEHLYTNQTEPYFRAPHIYVALPARFLPDRQVFSDAKAKETGIYPLPHPDYTHDCSEGVFMTTRGGDQYDRTFMEGFIRPGIGALNWVSRTNYPLWGVVPTSPTEMSIYVNRHYAHPSWHIQRCVLRIDGFASVNAPYSGGEMVTKPMKFDGEELTINYATGASGSIRIEVQDTEGQAVLGYSINEATEIIGDEIERVVSWTGGSDVSKMAGKPVRLRFVMKDVDLYSLQFRKSPRA